MWKELVDVWLGLDLRRCTAARELPRFLLQGARTMPYIVGIVVAGMSSKTTHAMTMAVRQPPDATDLPNEISYAGFTRRGIA